VILLHRQYSVRLTVCGCSPIPATTVRSGVLAPGVGGGRLILQGTSFAVEPSVIDALPLRCLTRGKEASAVFASSFSSRITSLLWYGVPGRNFGMPPAGETRRRAGRRRRGSVIGAGDRRSVGSVGWLIEGWD
jgi:hypothetical protein